MLLLQKDWSRLLFAVTLGMISTVAQAEPRYVLEKVVEVSRHGVRPPTSGNRQAMQAGTGREWPQWLTRDGELTGHGYAAAALKGRYEADYYRRQGLLASGCPSAGAVYVWASPLQRTRATAQALMDGAFPGCGVAIHAAATEQDPLFQTDKMGLAPLDAERASTAIRQAMGGSPEQVKTRFGADIRRLQAAVCLPQQACPAFEQPWEITQEHDGRFSINGLGTLSNMAESIRLAYSENQPTARVAFGHGVNASAVAPLLPLLTARYDFTNDVPYIAQRGGSVLLNQIALALAADQTSAGAPPAARWLLFVAHDTNIAYLRTLLGFSWQQGLYPRGNIPPAGSLVFERWRDRQTDQRFLRLYFQAQSLDQIRQLSPLSALSPPLKTEFSHPGCRQLSLGVLCPWAEAMQRMHAAIDPTALPAVQYRP
ncbi:histidine-type phosphatase [Serratia sp. AKBS12]|uniref:histidine-type phosphatase n=1 Tax=Serratia sp. AKBS12 TaxID=2974597 RepID=UPI0021661BAF|nr:histidine-type phosphatase [Serratia sp. AKBS12]MCS3406521.1 histidine-type phosphatase [Serratia sp. AKBS12]HEI8868785.1 histidine-type phosphatase [Serratia odorifera]